MIRKFLKFLTQIKYDHSYWEYEEYETLYGRFSMKLLDVYSVPYGLETHRDWEIVDEIERRWKQGQDMYSPSNGYPNGVIWEPNDNPHHPANNISHPYYVGKKKD